MYESITDAKTALENSGVLDWFDYDQLDDVVEFMYRNDATPDDAAKHYGVA